MINTREIKKEVPKRGLKKRQKKSKWQKSRHQSSPMNNYVKYKQAPRTPGEDVGNPTPYDSQCSYLKTLEGEQKQAHGGGGHTLRGGQL